MNPSSVLNRPTTPDVFVGHGVTFTNDLFPRTTNVDGGSQTADDGKILKTLVKKGTAIGSNATIFSSITVGENAVVDAGAVVTKNVPPGMVVARTPAKILRKA